jgi:hypothetical protein
MRIYYRGAEDGIEHPGLPGVSLSFGGAVDVHDEDLAQDLLALEWFTAQPPTGEPVPVVYEVVEQTAWDDGDDVSGTELSPGPDEQADMDEEDL